MNLSKKLLFVGLALCLLLSTVFVAGCDDDESGEATLSSVTVYPTGDVNTVIGRSHQYQAMAVYSDGSTTDVTSQVSWSVSDTSIAIHSENGLVSVIAAGTATISVSYKGMSSSATIYVTKDTITVVDNEDNYVDVSLPVNRIASITSGASEIICALGDSGKIVARDSYSLFPYYLETVTEVADSSYSPNVELLLAQNLDLVVADGMLPEDKKAQIEAAGVPVIIESTTDPDAMLNCLKDLGLLLDKQDKADEVAAYIQGYRDLVDERVGDLEVEDKPLVFWEWTKAYKTTNSAGVFHKMIVEAGGINIAAGESVSYPVVAGEWVMQTNPDIIIKSPSGQVVTETIMQEARDELMARTELSIVDAVKNDKVYLINSDLRHATRFAVGLLYYAKWFHPTLFEDIEPAAVHQELVETLFGAEAWQALDEVYAYP